MRAVLIIIFYLIHWPMRAQTQLTPDTTAILKLYRSLMFLPYERPDSALQIADSIVSMSLKLNYKFGEACGFETIGECHVVKGNYPAAIQAKLKALNLFTEVNDLAGMASCNLGIGSVYNELGEWRIGLKYMFIHRKFCERLPESFFDRAFGEFGSKSLMILNSDHNISKAYLEGSQLDSALYFATRALHTDRELHRDWSAPPVVLGDIYVRLGHDSSALANYNLPVKLTFEFDEVERDIGKAGVFMRGHQLDSCRFFAKNALEVASRRGYLKSVLKASNLLAASYKDENFPEFLKYLEISTRTRDSLYSREKLNQANSIIFGNEMMLRDRAEAAQQYSSRIRTYSLVGLSAFFMVAGSFLWRNNVLKRKSNALLLEEKEKVDKAYADLKTTQSQLIQSEKMASLGELTAGIAHEIQNPLNFVNNFSELNKELIQDLKKEVQRKNLDEIESIATNIESNEEKIHHHGQRADAIVKSMLQHSRTSSGHKELTDINALCDEYLRLAYHGYRAKDKTFNAEYSTHFDPSLPKVSIIPQDIARVLLNLTNNAFYTLNEKAKQQRQSSDFRPHVGVSTKKHSDRIEISVKDNGNGIADSIKEKIFQPFFTTKPTGSGTGLGLSLSYDIIRAHGGRLEVNSSEGVGSEFIIQLPS